MSDLVDVRLVSSPQQHLREGKDEKGTYYTGRFSSFSLWIWNGDQGAHFASVALVIPQQEFWIVGSATKGGTPLEQKHFTSIMRRGDNSPLLNDEMFRPSQEVVLIVRVYEEEGSSSKGFADISFRLKKEVSLERAA